MKNSWISIGIFSLMTFSTGSLAQNSIIPIYNAANEFVRIFEEKGYEIVHLDFNNLTPDDFTDETRREFSSSYEYLILAYADKLKLRKIQLELYVSEDNKWKIVKSGVPLTDDFPNTSSLKLSPEKTKNYLIKIIAKEFAPGSNQGRIFFAVGNKLRISSVETSAREYVRWNKNTNNIKYSDYESFKSSFEINVTGHLVKHTIYDNPITYYIKEKGSTEAQEKLGIYSYTCETIGGTSYILTIDIVKKTIMIIEYSEKKILNGYIYHLTGDIM